MIDKYICVLIPLTSRDMSLEIIQNLIIFGPNKGSFFSTKHAAILAVFFCLKKGDKMDHFRNLIKLSSSLHFGAMNHYKNMGFQYMDVPAIVGITGSCENVDTLFKVKSRVDAPLYFTQTGQLALEQALQYSSGVYTIIHSGRDEEIEDERHLRQFRLIEEEFDSTTLNMTRDTYNEEVMYEELLRHIEEATKSMISGVLNDNEEILNNFYQRSTINLKNILSRPYLRIAYEEAVELLKENGYPDLKFGDDLEAIHEAKIVELVNKAHNYGTHLAEFSPVLIMRYPKEIKFFNMKVSEVDPRVVLSADCVFPYSGEAVGSAVREHDGIKLLVRLLTSNMFRILQNNGGRYEDFKWYVEDMIIAQKTQPHAGYGIGSERVLQFILGSSDIRQCSVMSLLASQTRDWLPLSEKEKVTVKSPIEVKVNQ